MMSRKEKRILAATGAIGTALTALGSTLTASAIVGEWEMVVALISLGTTAVGGALLAGVNHYRDSITEATG